MQKNIYRDVLQSPSSHRLFQREFVSIAIVNINEHITVIIDLQGVAENTIERCKGYARLIGEQSAEQCKAPL